MFKLLILLLLVLLQIFSLFYIYKNKASYITDKYKNKYWLNELKKYHRLDGPAIEYANGDKCWCINGKFHRLDGPAIECVNGDKAWYINGKFHREGGPAVESINGDKVWYLNDNYYKQYLYNIIIYLRSNNEI